MSRPGCPDIDLAELIHELVTKTAPAALERGVKMRKLAEVSVELARQVLLEVERKPIYYADSTQIAEGHVGCDGSLWATMLEGPRTTVGPTWDWGELFERCWEVFEQHSGRARPRTEEAEVVSRMRRIREAQEEDDG